MAQRLEECAAFDVDLHLSPDRLADLLFRRKMRPENAPFSCVWESPERPQDSSGRPYQNGVQRAKKSHLGDGLFCPVFRPFLELLGPVRRAFTRVVAKSRPKAKRPGSLRAFLASD